MKRIVLITSAFILFWGLRSGSAQHIDYTNDSGFNFGFGIGGSYQTSDVRNSSGGAFDFTFGHSIFQKESAIFSLDWRFRFLAGQNKAFDDRINADSTYNNVKYSHLNMDLELVLTLNRLRNRTGLILSAFAGPGLAYNQTSFDYYDNFGGFGSNIPYDYSVIDPFGLESRNEIIRELKVLSDGDFETPGIDHFCFTPTFGAYIGYQISKHFSLGIQHKSNLFLRENYSSIGADIDGAIRSGSPYDLNHYTSLVLMWDIGRRDKVEVVPCNTPDVSFSVTKVNNGYATHELRGTVTNVRFNAEISLTVDGIPNYDFQYLTGNNTLSAGLKLSPGTHTVIITAANDCGTDSQTATVFVNAPCDPPRVDFVLTPVNRSYATHELTGTIKNVTEKSVITVTIDGKKDYGFSFSSTTQEISTFYQLSPGTHTVIVTASNDCGTDTQTSTISVGEPCNPPVVNFSVNETTLSYATHQLEGFVDNVSYKSNISLTVDGIPNNGFQFNSSTNKINNDFNFTPGTHTVVVSATNDCGTDSKTVTVFVNAPCMLPEIYFSVNEINLNYATHELTGTVNNVAYKSNISLTIDGIPNNGFQFNSSTKRIRTTFNLSPGKHTVVVTASNDCGTEYQSVSVFVNVPCDLPVVNFNVNEITLNYATHQLEGFVDNVSYKSNISLTVDGIPNNGFQFNSSTKRISTTFNFSPGTHTVVVIASNDCGTDSKTVSVFVAAPCDFPVVNFSVNEITLNYATHELTGTVNNVAYKSNITLTVDGITNNGFQFNPNTKRISTTFNFSPGSHTVEVSASNDCGTDSKTVTVYVNAPCDLPVIDFTVVESNQGSFTHKLNGTVFNVSNKSDITLKVDGISNNAFQFIPNTHAISARLNLSPGTHTVVLTATNSCGTYSQTVTVYVNVPCEKPLVNINVVEANQGSFTHKLNGTVTNVNNKSDISLKVDGVINNAFQFIPNTHAISANLNLTPGTHTVVVTATNSCGTDSQTVTVVVDAPCDPPVVNFNVIEAPQGSFTHKLTGTVTNVTNKSEISLKIDGVTNNAFQFNPNTHAISANLNLTPGTHTVVVSAANSCGNDSQTVTVVVDAPCDPPAVSFSVIEAPQGSFTHKLNGTVSNVTNKSEITLKVDGITNNAFQFNPNTHAISANLNLTPGTHTVVVSAANSCGNDSQTVTVVVDAPCDPPVVNFNVVEAPQGSFTHKLTGTVTNVNNKSDISLKVDGVTNNAFQFNPNTHAISANLNLTPGTHTIVVSAANSCGNDSQTVTVVVDAPCDPPVVNFNVVEAPQGSFTHKLSGTVSNVTNKSEITLKVDGVTNNAFQFNPNTHGISANLNLTPGTHTVVVSAANSCGNDSQTVTVVVDAPCDPPVVNFNVVEAPQGSFTHKLTGTVTNVTNKSEISLKIDGVTNNAFQFNPNTHAISANLNLTPGTHTVVVSAANSCGNDSQTVTVVVDAPCDPPVVNFSVVEAPQGSFTHKLTGTVTNVTNKSEISLKIDGVTNNAFQFNPNTHAISANLNLTPGTHTVVVSAANSCGNDSQTVTVVVDAPCDPPVVNFSVVEAPQGSFTHKLTGTVTNVTNKSEISLKIDGVTNNAFQFIPNTHAISANLNLTPGTHTVVVSAANSCGNDSQTVTVVVDAPCDPPVVNFNVVEAPQGSFTHKLSGTVSNVTNKSEITLKVDGVTNNAFQFNPNTHAISANLNLTPGTHTIVVSAANSCGNDSQTVTVVVDAPCDPPVVNFSVVEAPQGSSTHKLTGTVTNVTNKSEITLMVDGVTNNAFQFNPNTHAISANLTLTPGNHTIVVTAANSCGTDTKSTTITVEESACGPRINPGNDDWQFCLVTPSGTYNRSDLSNTNFSYSGSASSLFFKAIAGGGNATVNGNPYTIIPGNYYLFTGNLTVSVSTSNPGSMGHWSVCINASAVPQFGNGNNRPLSPCEGSNNNGNGKNNGGKNDGGN